MGITDNEKDDCAAQQASHHPKINLKLPTRSNLAHFISQSIRHAWVTKWQELQPTNKLAALKETFGTHLTSLPDKQI